MTLRRTSAVIFSVVLSLFLVAILLKIGNLNLRFTIKQLTAVPGSAFAVLLLLTALHIQLSNFKWRTVDATIRRCADSVPSAATSFAVTSAGVALGQVLPVQFSMTAARTVGTYFYGRTFKRGTVGTLFEQSFDLVTVFCLVLASALTRLKKGTGGTWLTFAVLITALSLLSVAPAVRLIRRLATGYSIEKSSSLNRMLRGFSELQSLGLLNPRLLRKLMIISTLRFVIQVLMAEQSARAIGAHIPLWHLAAALPFATISCLVAITPGGLGVGELSIAAALRFFGTPIEAGAQWAFANRVLLAGASFIIAGCGGIVACLERSVGPGRPLMEERRALAELAPDPCNPDDRIRPLE